MARHLQNSADRRDLLQEPGHAVQPAPAGEGTAEHIQRAWVIVVQVIADVAPGVQIQQEAEGKDHDRQVNRPFPVDIFRSRQGQEVAEEIKTIKGTDMGNAEEVLTFS